MGDLDSYVDILLSPDTCSGGGWAKFIRLVRSLAHLRMTELEDDTDIWEILVVKISVHTKIYFSYSGPRAVTQKFSTADLLLRTKIQQYFSVSDSGCSFIGDTDELKEFNKIKIKKSQKF